MAVSNRDPIYPISVAAKLLGVHPRTIRIYEDEGLIKPARQGQKRYFSQDDIQWIECLRHLIHEDGISIPGIKKLLSLSPCWEIKVCPPEKRDRCSAYIDRTGKGTQPCWEVANKACAKDFEQCASCEVFVQAMKKSKAALEKREGERGDG
jgi:MerR family transcriptional regulator, heat shock protein HspR